jgi:hypothetical protein
MTSMTAPPLTIRSSGHLLSRASPLSLSLSLSRLLSPIFCPSLQDTLNAIMSVPLTKVDSAIAGLSISDEKPIANEKEVKKGLKKDHKRTSSTSEGIWNIKDLGEDSSIFGLHPD